MISFFRHAAVALDLSEASDLIVDCVSSFQNMGTKKITLITVLSVPFEQKDSELDTTREQKQLDDYKKMLEEKGFEVDTEIRTGLHYYPPTEILTAANEADADFVVISNRGESKVKELLSGSTASELLQRSKLPVYLINLGLQEDSGESGERSLLLPQPCSEAPKHVLYATDFSDSAYRAYKVLRDMEGAGIVDRISMIHVQGHHAIAIKDPVSRNRLTEQNREQLDRIRNKLSDRTREDTELIITFGSPAKEIVEAAKERNSTMIMMGSQGKGFVQELFLGSVSNKVTRLSDTPVLLIPVEREKEES
ncbi:MAG TPA: universal stress protein [Balneolaceae bacterium]|nr:universal stress protein [Balneolaceae bacterium]